MVDETEKQTGIQDVIGIASLMLGNNFIGVPGKPHTATYGTSPASLFFRKHLSITFKRRVLPTLTNKSFSLRGVRIFWVNNLGAFAGRAVPVLGWIIVSRDVSIIAFKSLNHYNMLVRQEDKIW